MRRSQRFREKALRRFAITCWTQEELERVALRIHGAIEVYEVMNMVRKGQMRGVEKEDIMGQIAFIASLFGVAA